MSDQSWFCYFPFQDSYSIIGIPGVALGVVHVVAIVFSWSAPWGEAFLRQAILIILDIFPLYGKIQSSALFPAAFFLLPASNLLKQRSEICRNESISERNSSLSLEGQGLTYFKYTAGTSHGAGHFTERGCYWISVVHGIKRIWLVNSLEEPKPAV